MPIIVPGTTFGDALPAPPIDTTRPADTGAFDDAGPDDADPDGDGGGAFAFAFAFGCGATGASGDIPSIVRFATRAGGGPFATGATDAPHAGQCAAPSTSAVPQVPHVGVLTGSAPARSRA